MDEQIELPPLPEKAEPDPLQLPVFLTLSERPGVVAMVGEQRPYTASDGYVNFSVELDLFGEYPMWHLRDWSRALSGVSTSGTYPHKQVSAALDPRCGLLASDLAAAGLEDRLLALAEALRGRYLAADFELAQNRWLVEKWLFDQSYSLKINFPQPEARERPHFDLPSL